MEQIKSKYFESGADYIAIFEPFRLNSNFNDDEGYSIRLIDKSSMECVAGCRQIPARMCVGMAPYYAVVTKWKEFVSKYGSKIELDLSKTPELTEDSVRLGGLATDYKVIVKDTFGRNAWRSLGVYNNYSKLPLFLLSGPRSTFQDEKDDQEYAIRWSKVIKKYFIGNLNLDISNAPSLGKYFKELI